MTTGSDAQAGRDQELRDDYRKLAGLGTPHPVTRRLSEDQWVESNLLLDQGLTEADVAEREGVSSSVIIMMSNARRCLELHKWDPEALKQCLDAAKSS
jgi:hypothetical protein